MKTRFQELEYAYTIEPINSDVKNKVMANTRHHIKGYYLFFSSIAVVVITLLFFLELTKEDLVKYLIISLLSLNLLLFLTTVIMPLRSKIALKNKYKIVEKGIITNQDTGGDSETINYSYIGTNAYASLHGNIIIGDRISIAQILTKQNKKNLFIQAQKI